MKQNLFKEFFKPKFFSFYIPAWLRYITWRPARRSTAQAAIVVYFLLTAAIAHYYGTKWPIKGTAALWKSVRRMITTEGNSIWWKAAFETTGFGGCFSISNAKEGKWNITGWIGIKMIIWWNPIILNNFVRNMLLEYRENEKILLTCFKTYARMQKMNKRIRWNHSFRWLSLFNHQGGCPIAGTKWEFNESLCYERNKTDT